VGRTNQEPELVSVVITSDGRRFPVRFRDTQRDVALLSSIRELGLGLLALITGSRREPGGRRR